MDRGGEGSGAVDGVAAKGAAEVNGDADRGVGAATRTGAVRVVAPWTVA